MHQPSRSLMKIQYGHQAPPTVTRIQSLAEFIKAILAKGKPPGEIKRELSRFGLSALADLRQGFNRARLG